MARNDYRVFVAKSSDYTVAGQTLARTMWKSTMPDSDYANIGCVSAPAGCVSGVFFRISIIPASD